MLPLIKGCDVVLKKMIVIFCMTVLFVCITGCSAVFSNSYRSEQDFQGNEKINLDANVQVVQNYSELRRLIFGMVNNHSETTELVFSGYTGNVVSDIASVCNAIKTESSYGAYCVDYVSYDLRQIVSSYEANIHISYLYSAEELQNLQTTSNMESFTELLIHALEKEDDKLVVRVNNGVSETENVRNIMEHAIRNHPLSISYQPKFTVKIFDGNTSQKIYDVSIQYDNQNNNLTRLEKINESIIRMVSDIKEDSIENRLVAAAVSLSDRCVYNQQMDGSAYLALVEGESNSEGIACAFKALCDQMGVECQVVTGRMDKQPYFWNIVKIEDAYYHMDISALGQLGAENSLFMKDSEKQVNCWWNQSEYPECDGPLTYAAVK